MKEEEQKKPLLGGPLVVINVGLTLFHDSLKDQGTPVVQVDWRPPAAGDHKMVGLLDKLLD